MAFHSTRAGRFFKYDAAVLSRQENTAKFGALFTGDRD